MPSADFDREHGDRAPVEPFDGEADLVILSLQHDHLEQRQVVVGRRGRQPRVFAR